MDWLLSLASSGATTLVGAAATDAWQYAKAGFVRLFGRGDDEREAVARRRLDALAAEIEREPEEQRSERRQELLPAWQTRLGDLLEEDGDTAVPLRTLLEELQQRLPAAQLQWVQHITASGSGSVAQGVMFGNIVNHAGPPPQ